MAIEPSLPRISVLFDRVLLRPEDSTGERRSRSGILIPATAHLAKRLSWAVVVTVGPHVRSVTPDQRVLFSADDQLEVECDGENFIILRERDLHGVATPEASTAPGLYL
jgi:chaperonin GroES